MCCSLHRLRSQACYHTILTAAGVGSEVQATSPAAKLTLTLTLTLTPTLTLTLT